MKEVTKLSLIWLAILSAALVLFSRCSKDNNPGGGSIAVSCEDVDGHLYEVTKIGNYFVMKENLRVTSFNDGTPLLILQDPVEWAGGPAAALCTYPYSEIDGLGSTLAVQKAYGVLYNWNAVNDPRKLCPAGWRVPSKDEWAEIIEALGGEDVAGGKMKSTRTNPDSHPRWEAPNTGATNESGFTGVPGGYRYKGGTFYDIGTYGAWWSSTIYENDYIHTFSLSCYDAVASPDYGHKRAGYSVRCIY